MKHLIPLISFLYIAISTRKTRVPNNAGDEIDEEELEFEGKKVYFAVQHV